MTTRGKKQRTRSTDLNEFEHYSEARAIAAQIAERDGLNQDLIFSDAMHVAAALAMDKAGVAYSKRNAAQMFEQLRPAELRLVLQFRLDDPDAYKKLPMAGVTESLTPTEVRAASSLADKLTPAQLDALFFGEVAGRA